ncbi:hypothetical protein ACTFIW_005298 [Dictyostelium discoideum]
MKPFSIILFLFYFFIFYFGSCVISESIGDNQSHFIYAFQINNETYSNQYFIVIDPSQNTVVKNVSINVPNGYVINGILGIDQLSNSILLYSINDLFSKGSILSLNLNSNEISVIDSPMLNFRGTNANQPYAYSSDVVYMTMKTSNIEPSVNCLAKYDFSKQSSLCFHFDNFASDLFPLLAYDQKNNLMYIAYSPLSLSQTNLMVIDTSGSLSVEKRFNSIKGLQDPSKNTMLLTSPNTSNLFLIQINKNNDLMEMCQFDAASNSCNNVFSTKMINNNNQFNPFQLTLDKSGLIISNLINKSDNDGGDMVTEISIIDLDTLLPISSFTINNYFDSSNPSIKYYFSYF